MGRRTNGTGGAAAMPPETVPTNLAERAPDSARVRAVAQTPAGAESGGGC